MDGQGVFLPRTEPYCKTKLYAKCLSFDDSGPDRNNNHKVQRFIYWKKGEKRQEEIRSLNPDTPGILKFAVPSK